jgi:hypothetical protein
MANSSSVYTINNKNIEPASISFINNTEPVTFGSTNKQDTKDINDLVKNSRKADPEQFVNAAIYATDKPTNWGSVVKMIVTAALAFATGGTFAVAMVAMQWALQAALGPEVSPLVDLGMNIASSNWLGAAGNALEFGGRVTNSKELLIASSMPRLFRSDLSTLGKVSQVSGALAQVTDNPKFGYLSEGTGAIASVQGAINARNAKNQQSTYSDSDFDNYVFEDSDPDKPVTFNIYENESKLTLGEAMVNKELGYRDSEPETFSGSSDLKMPDSITVYNSTQDNKGSYTSTAPVLIKNPSNNPDDPEYILTGHNTENPTKQPFRPNVDELLPNLKQDRALYTQSLEQWADGVRDKLYSRNDEQIREEILQDVRRDKVNFAVEKDTEGGFKAAVAKPRPNTKTDKFFRGSDISNQDKQDDKVQFSTLTPENSDIFNMLPEAKTKLDLSVLQKPQKNRGSYVSTAPKVRVNSDGTATLVPHTTEGDDVYHFLDTESIEQAKEEKKQASPFADRTKELRLGVNQPAVNTKPKLNKLNAQNGAVMTQEEFEAMKFNLPSQEDKKPYVSTAPVLKVTPEGETKLVSHRHIKTDEKGNMVDLRDNQPLYEFPIGATILEDYNDPKFMKLPEHIQEKIKNGTLKLTPKEIFQLNTPHIRSVSAKTPSDIATTADYQKLAEAMAAFSDQKSADIGNTSSSTEKSDTEVATTLVDPINNG